MTPKEIFATVSTHLLTQKKKSLRDVTSWCAYRGQNGLKCAVGVLIPDSIFTPDMENKDLSQLLISHGSLLPDFFLPNKSLLARLQRIHDYADPEEWKEALVRCKIEYNLEE